VPYLFARALPFVAHEAAVTGQAGAAAVAGPPGPSGANGNPPAPAPVGCPI
jgi:hypothetical protein